MKNKIERLKKAIHTIGGSIKDQQDEIHNAYKDLSKDEVVKLLLKQNELLKEKETIIDMLENERPKRIMKTKDIELYDILNFHKFNRTEDGKILKNDPSLYAYDPFESAFDKNLKKNKQYYRDYQKKFIENWTLSAQELVILYYGVGSGKTMIAVNCAEQYQEITQNAHVYFLVPASLVLGTIKEMYDRGIQADRKNEKGEYIYYFVSYQQLLRSNFDFKENSLLIIDEAHNLRNIRAVEINEKINARKYKKTGNYSLVGNKLSEKLIQSSGKFLRTIFMTGTLFVNSSEDIEALMAIGYKKQPILEIDRFKYDSILNSDEEFKIYYEGLISYYKVPKVSSMPTKKFHFIAIVNPKMQYRLMIGNRIEPYLLFSRNQSIKEKTDWTIKFLLRHKNQKTLIYSQFLDLSLKELMDELNERKINYGFISGKLSMVQKLNVVKQYNDGEINILIFTLSIKEGISFRETDNIIIFQPYWNYAIMEQILARGIRLTSHKYQNKATINLYFLVTVKSMSHTKNWFQKADQIMNNDIKDFVFDIIEKDGLKKKDYGVIGDPHSSGDIDLYNRMFRKQEEINVFERKLLSLPRFEDVSNNENNLFIENFNTELLEYDNKNGKAPSIKETVAIKKKMYLEYYKQKISELDKRIVRFNEDLRYRENRNPNLEEKASSDKYGDKSVEIKKLIKKNAPIGDYMKLFNIGKQDITLFQANFTPSSEINIVIDKSGIKNDKRTNIKILEPTAGVGNFVDNLLKLENKFNFMIDCNEYNNAFYQIGKNMYDEIDNVKWYNGDFWIYQNKYNYDYILGNPPFNLSHQVLEKTEITNKKGEEFEPIFKKVDKRLYDIHFVSKAYNMLNDGGVLSMIISDRFLRDKSGVFVIFNIYLDDMKKLNPSSVEIIKTGEFKEDKTISKEMETNFGMVCITLKKLENFNIDLDNKKRIKNTINNFEKKSIKESNKAISDLGIEKSLTKKKRKVNIDKPKAVKKPIEKKVKKTVEKRKSLLEEFREALRNA
jgi:superfamily II DNA or RNA helicase